MAKQTDISKILIAACYLIACSFAEASVRVEPIVWIECSPRAQLTVVLDGKPVAGVRVKFFNVDFDNGSSSRFAFSARTNGKGFLILPTFPPADHRVDAILHQNRNTFQSSIWLRIVPQSPETRISIDLTKARDNAFQLANELQSRLTEAAQGPHANGKVHRGIVVDRIGRPIPSVSVTLYKRRTQSWNVLLKTDSDSKGKFSTKKLKEGDYVAVFSASGFQSAMVPFEVSENESGSLRVALKIGYTDVAIPNDSSRIATTGNWQLITDH